MRLLNLLGIKNLINYLIRLCLKEHKFANIQITQSPSFLGDQYRGIFRLSA